MAANGPGASPPPGGEEAADRFASEMERQEAVRKRTSQYYYEEGLRRFNEADYARAEPLFRQAVEQDPTNVQARERLFQCMMFLGKRDGEIRSLLQELGEEIQVGQQAQLAEVGRMIEDGKRLLDEGEVQQALRALSRARERLIYFDFGVDVTALRGEAQTLFDEARNRERQAVADDRQRRESAALVEQERLSQQDQDRARQRVETILASASEAQMRRDYRAAVQLYRQVIELDPQNKAAQRGLMMAQEFSMAQRSMDLRESMHLESEKVWEELSEAAIPYDDPFTFPEDRRFWQVEVKGRSRELQSLNLDESYEVRQIRNTLATLPISFDFSGETTLDDAIAYIRDISGLNITVDPAIDTIETKVKMKLDEVQLEQALDLLLRNTGLAYAFRENTLYITEPGKAFGDQIFDVYNVTDILNKIRNFPGPTIRVRSGDETDEGSASPFGGFADSDEEEDSTLDPDSLRDLIIESTGGEEVWDASGSKIEPHKGQLLVTATRELHVALKSFLDNLRKDSDLFVIVESRFIDIVDDFLEDIGVDSRNLGQPPGSGFGTAYGTMNSGRSGGLDQGFSNLGDPTKPSLLMGQNRTAGRIQHILDGFVSGASGTRLTSALRGLTLQATWLDPFQLNAILRASQEQRESRIITAPRVTASNGQRVYVSVITQRAYVQDYELVSGGTGLVVQEVADPVVATFQDGVILDVQPVISSDRKYITLDVRPTIASLVNGVISTVTISLGSITQAAQLVDIDLPEISLQQAFTSVTVPDGGTVLLGGFRSLNERKYESTVPLLGKIWLIKNLFRRKAYLREGRSLYMMLTATVVDLRAEERRLFN